MRSGYPERKMGFIQNLPLFNPGCQAYHQAWKKTDTELGEVRDLAVKFNRQDEDIQALDLYRSTAAERVAAVKKCDVIQTVVEPIWLIGGLCGFVGVGILALNGVFPSFQSGLIAGGATLATSYLGGAIYFKNLSNRRRNDPNTALANLPYEVRSRVGTLLAQKDSMREVSTLHTALKPQATTTVAISDTRVVLGGVVVRKRGDGTALVEGTENPRHPNPSLLGR